MGKEEKMAILKKIRTQVEQWKEHPEILSSKQDVVIDDKIMFLKGYSDNGKGELSTYESRIKEGRRTDCSQVIQILEHTKAGIAQKTKDFTIHCDKFLEYLELRLELAGIDTIDFEKDPRFQKFTKPELEEFDQIIKRTNKDAYIIDNVTQYIHCIYLEQIYELDDYDNGAIYIKTLNDAREALYEYRKNNPSSFINVPPEILNMMISLKLKYGLKEEDFTPGHIYKFLNSALKTTKTTISYIKQVYRIIGEKSLQARNFQISSETTSEEIAALLSHPLIKSLPDLTNILNEILKEKNKILFKNKLEEKISKYNQIIESVIGQYLKALVNKLKEFSIYAPNIIKSTNLQNIDPKSLESLEKSVNSFLIDIKRIAEIVGKDQKIEEAAFVTPPVDPLIKRLPKFPDPLMSFYSAPIKYQNKTVSYKGKNPDKPMYEIIPYSNYTFANIDPDLLPRKLGEYIKMVGMYFYKSYFKDVIMNKNIQDIIDEIITLESQKEKENPNLSL